MKILHVISGMNPKQGGVCQAVRSIIKGLYETERTGSEVVCLDVPDASYLKSDCFPIHALGPGKGPWAYSSRLRPWLDINIPRFDIVIIHGIWLYHSYATYQAMQHLPLRLPHRPHCYVMAHGMLDPYFQRDSARRMKALRNTLYWKVIEHQVVNKADGLLFTCEEEKLLARQSFRPYSPKEEHVVGLGVEEPPTYIPEMKTAFTAACPDLSGNPYLLFLSRIHPKKGVDLLIRAYAELVNSTLRTPHSAFPLLVIAGPLDSDYAREMQQLAKELLASNSLNSALRIPHSAILFPGMLQGDAKWGAFYGCEAFILPSHQENFGIAVVEALACGKPVLISNKVNIWREIIDSSSGIADSDDLKGTCELLNKWFIARTNSLSPLFQNPRETYRKKFEVDATAINLSRILNLNKQR